MIAFQSSRHPAAQYLAPVQRAHSGSGALVRQHRFGEGRTSVNVHIEHDASARIESRSLLGFDGTFCAAGTEHGAEPVHIREKTLEVADVHRELFAQNAESYGEDVRIKVERCLAVRDSEVERGTRRREEYAERMREALDGIDLVLTPTLQLVAPPLGTGSGDLAVRESLIRFTFPFSALGWPALALPCGAAEDGLPASVQLAGRSGADALVLAAGRVLEAELGVRA